MILVIARNWHRAVCLAVLLLPTSQACITLLRLMIFTAGYSRQLPFMRCLGFLVLLSFSFPDDVNMKSPCVDLCPTPENLSACKASIDIGSAINAMNAGRTSVLPVIHKSTRLTLEASLNLLGKCYDSYDVKWAWSATNGRGQPLIIRGIAIDNPILDIPPYVLDIGRYNFRVDAALTKPKECITMNPLQDYLAVHNQISIKVNMTGLKINLFGASQLRVSSTQNSVFSVEVSKIYDPDGRVKMSDVLYGYACDTLTNYRLQRNVTARYKRKADELTISIFEGDISSSFTSESNASTWTNSPANNKSEGALATFIPTYLNANDGVHSLVWRQDDFTWSSLPGRKIAFETSYAKSIVRRQVSPAVFLASTTPSGAVTSASTRVILPTVATTFGIVGSYPRPSLCRGLHRPFRYSNSSILTFQTSDFPPTDKYVFRVYAVVPSGKYKQKACEEMIIDFVNYTTAVYDILCEHNCDPKYNLAHKIKLKYRCKICLAPGDIEWQVESIDDNQQKTIVPLNWLVDTKFPKDSEDIEINPGVLKSSSIQSVNFTLIMAKYYNSPTVSMLIPVLRTSFKWRCQVWPKEGWELITEFTINCTDLSPDKTVKKWEDIQYFQYVQRLSPSGRIPNDVVLRYSSLPFATKVRLVAGDKNSDYKAKILVTVAEKYGLKTTVNVSIPVRPICTNDTCFAANPECLLKLVTDSKAGSNYFSRLNRAGNHQIAIATAHVIIHMLNRYEHLTTASQMAQIRQGLVYNVGECTSLLIPSISQVLHFISSVFHSSAPEEYLYATQLRSLEILETCSEKLEEQSAESKEYEETSITSLAHFAGHILSDIFTDFHDAHTITSPSNMTRSLSQITLPLLHFEHILHSVADTLYPYLEMNRTLKMDTLYFDMYIRQIRLQEVLGSYHYRSSNRLDIEELGYFIIPDQLASNTALVQKNVSIEFIQFKRNPLMLGAKDTKGRHVLPLFLFVRDLTSKALMTNQLGPVDFGLTCLGGAGPAQYHGITVKSTNFQDEDVNIHRTSLPPSDEVRTVMLSVSLTSPSHSVQALMQERWEPREKNFSNKSIVRILTEDDVRTDLRRENVAFHRVAATQRKNTNLYAGILPTADTAKQLIRAAKSQNVRPILLYASRMSKVQCLHYDYVKADWTSEGCSVVTDGRTNEDVLHCRCTALSRFWGISQPLPVTSIRRFDSFEFYLNVPFNWVIVIFLLILVILFALLFLLATWMDALLSYKLGVTVVEDNDPEFTYGYLVSVSTSSGFGSGTTSVPAIQLHGEDGTSSVHVLVDHKRQLLRTSSTDYFLITTQSAIKNIQSLTLVQKAVEPSPSWTLLRIVVSDLESGRVWEFYVNQRLDCDSMDPIERNYNGKAVPAHHRDRINSVTERIQKRFENDFIWTSVFLRPACSAFTSIQRVICIILLIELAFLFNLLIRGLPRHTPAQHIGVHGFRIFLSDIIYGLITAVILLVCVLILVYFLKGFFSKHVWKVYIDLRDDWNKHAKDYIARVEAEEEAARRKQATEYAAALQARESQMRRVSESYLLSLPNDKVFEINLEGILSKNSPPPPPPPPVQPPPAAAKKSTDRDSVSSAGSSGVFETEDDTGRFWYCRGRGCLWILLGLVIVLLIVLLYYLGHWYSETQTLLWIFSSLIGLLVCIFLLHPLALLIIAVVFPMKNTSDKNELRKVGLGNIFDQRVAMIRDKGTLDEFRQYLKYLREQPIYKVEGPSPDDEYSEKSSEKEDDRAQGDAKGKTSQGAMKKTNT